MVNARLHIICGNCGCNDMFTFEIDLEGKDMSDEDVRFEPAAYLKCKNCSTIHNVEDSLLKS